MFLNHTAEFDIFDPVQAQTSHQLDLSAETLLETPGGWQPAQSLRPGTLVATLDGGFVPLTATAVAADAPLVCIPGGTLSACSDVLLPADTHLALDAPHGSYDAALVSVPAAALVGWRGIARAKGTAVPCVSLSLASEEIVYAQTGLLLHTDTARGFFERKSYADTRALLALLDGTLPAPDLPARAPAHL